MNDGILTDLRAQDTPFCHTHVRRAWFDRHLPNLRFDSEMVVAAARPETRWQAAGVYFLVWEGMVCYVGQSRCIGARMVQYEREGRPFDGVAAIAGIPEWARSAVEYAYIHAWNPPWNVEKTRCDDLYDQEALQQAINGTCRSHVMPYRTPLVTREDMAWPTWRLQVREYWRSAAS
ncbi:GIY-YIG nuclease family protein [Luteibacter sp. SG786]|uniref:GIY-YIG nuclease family protein n=1 Tax=Luteibacter sp. SG786 TaxID=2587130 RepID=UPI00141F9A0D|nr:GIY-YIG nuclease family protein [Luteibacter sp. SG786]NII53600.1 hypothetical protein [Luteibacter sp. SG786]